jgi:ADP-ribose pyrophosphatase YjhB (NUDIX family)
VLPTDLTVCALVERDNQFLIVEETSTGVVVISQPGGHIEGAESPEEAEIRETLEETGCDIETRELLGVYLWIHPQSRQQFLRIIFTGTLLEEHHGRQLDDGINAVHWYSEADIRRRERDCRMPIVLRCIADYRNGQRQSSAFLSDMLPLQKNIHSVLANAALV